MSLKLFDAVVIFKFKSTKWIVQNVRYSNSTIQPIIFLTHINFISTNLVDVTLQVCASHFCFVLVFSTGVSCTLSPSIFRTDLSLYSQHIRSLSLVLFMHVPSTIVLSIFLCIPISPRAARCKSFLCGDTTVFLKCFASCCYHSDVFSRNCRRTLTRTKMRRFVSCCYYWNLNHLHYTKSLQCSACGNV